MATLRARHAPRFDALVGHPFFRAAQDGSLTAAGRDRYFVGERYFVHAARGIFAHLLTRAPSRAAARHLVGILDGLVNRQEPMFDRIFAQLGLTMPPHPRPAVAALADGMTAIARDGPYTAGIAAMAVAERCYLDVARTLAWDIAPDPTIRAWFQLHAEDDFVRGVQWLEDELDAAAMNGDDEAIDSAFLRAVDLEIAFHGDPLVPAHEAGGHAADMPA